MSTLRCEVTAHTHTHGRATSSANICSEVSLGAITSFNPGSEPLGQILCPTRCAQLPGLSLLWTGDSCASNISSRHPDTDAASQTQLGFHPSPHLTITLTSEVWLSKRVLHNQDSYSKSLQTTTDLSSYGLIAPKGSSKENRMELRMKTES